jgi:predicted metal-binding membrane protein
VEHTTASPVRLGLVVVAGLGWLYLIYMAWGMANMDQPAAQWLMPAMMHWGAVDLALVFVMWAVMMVAMMVTSIEITAMVRMSVP